MDNNELLTRIAAKKTDDPDEKSGDLGKLMKFLIVQVKDKNYAFFVEQIKEIVTDVPLYFVPFVPPYVRGFINRHGEPHTVFDLNALFEGEELESATFLISNFENDQIAFLTSGVTEILKIPENEVHVITSAEENEGFFLGSVSSKGAEIFILNLPNIVERLEHDI
ncbi:chemotaxis protein CheW [Desulfococcaceae bacterium HSG8]|nr:chemotaxis protein CheW [Desulfococcaceae bacterium HSG8]